MNHIDNQSLNVIYMLPQDDPLAALVTTNKIYNVYQFIDVVFLFMYGGNCVLFGIKFTATTIVIH